MNQFIAIPYSFTKGNEKDVCYHRSNMSRICGTIDEAQSWASTTLGSRTDFVGVSIFKLVKTGERASSPIKWRITDSLPVEEGVSYTSAPTEPTTTRLPPDRFY